MKIFRINESQLRKLFETESSCGDSEILDGEDTTKRFGSENSTQAIITDLDGEEEFSKPTVGSRTKADTMSRDTQFYGSNYGPSYGRAL